MPVRDILVTAIVFGSVPFILRRPSIGVIVWCWISYMNPHRLTWSFAYDLPFAQIVAIAIFAGMLLGVDRIRFPPFTLVTFLWLLFFLWMGVTTLFAVFPDIARPKYYDVFKMMLMAVVTIMIMHDKRKLHWLIWAIVIFIGFYGVKGGIFTLRSGGEYRVWGPPKSYIEDNNSLALATFMLLPLAYYLRSQAQQAWVRNGLLVAMLLMTVSAVGSYSRGGFLAGLSIAAFLLLKSRRKVLVAVAILIMIPALFLFMPHQWRERMDTITHYQQDASAMNRIEAWTMSYNAANDRFFGGGFGLWSPEMYAAYGPKITGKPPGTRGAHSIYFSILGEHGWIGLILFLGVFIAAWRTASRIIRQTRDSEEMAWLGDLARMLQVSFVAYATGGAFQSLAYFDYPWHLVAILVIGRRLVEEHQEQERLEEDIEVRVPRAPGLRPVHARRGAL